MEGHVLPLSELVQSELNVRKRPIDEKVLSELADNIQAVGVLQDLVVYSMNNDAYGVAASDRPGFSRLLDRMEHGNVLIVTKLDRLGCNAIDIRKTVEKLSELNIRVHCLALGGVDLTSPAGKMTMPVISAVAEFERDLLVE